MRSFGVGASKTRIDPLWRIQGPHRPSLEQVLERSGTPPKRFHGTTPGSYDRTDDDGRERRRVSMTMSRRSSSSWSSTLWPFSPSSHRPPPPSIALHLVVHPRERHAGETWLLERVTVYVRLERGHISYNIFIEEHHGRQRLQYASCDVHEDGDMSRFEEALRERRGQG